MAAVKQTLGPLCRPCATKIGTGVSMLWNDCTGFQYSVSNSPGCTAVPSNCSASRASAMGISATGCASTAGVTARLTSSSSASSVAPRGMEKIVRHNAKVKILRILLIRFSQVSGQGLDVNKTQGFLLLDQ